MSTRAMPPEEREAFLAEPHVGVLAVSGGDEYAPLAVPIWYAYEPGGPVSFITLDDSPKAELIRTAGLVSLCVQSEQLPYRYVTVAGPVVSLETPADPDERRALAHRYLGPELGDRYIASTVANASKTLTVRFTTRHWLTRHQSSRFD